MADPTHEPPRRRKREAFESTRHEVGHAPIPSRQAGAERTSLLEAAVQQVAEGVIVVDRDG